MSLFNDSLDSFDKKMKDIIGEIEYVLNQTSEKLNNSTKKTSCSIPLSKTEITAFRGLCAMEGKSATDKMAELIKDYLEEKRKQMK